MGLGKITRGLGKVGLAFEALGYVWSAGGALVKAIKRAPDARRDDVESRQGQGVDTAEGRADQERP